MSLTTVTKKLGKNHQKKNEVEETLKKDRQKFFDEVTRELARKPLAQKTVERPEAGDLYEWVNTYHPGWILIDEIENSLLLQEDPTQIRFAFVNHSDGKIYQRNAVQGAPFLDDEALAEDHPEVWKRISEPTHPEWLPIINEFINFIGDPLAGVDDDLEGKFFRYITEKDDWPRELIPIEDINDEDLPIFMKYMVPGRISLRLEAPRNAKPEELNEDDHGRS